MTAEKVSPDLCRYIFPKINPCRSEIKYKAESKELIRNFAEDFYSLFKLLVCWC